MFRLFCSVLPFSRPDAASAAVPPFEPAKPMRTLSALALLMPLLMASPAVAAAPVVPHEVDIPLPSGTLKAQLFKPAGEGPFPTVIALHGCGGLAARSDP